MHRLAVSRHINTTYKHLPRHIPVGLQSAGCGVEVECWSGTCGSRGSCCSCGSGGSAGCGCCEPL